MAHSFNISNSNSAAKEDSFFSTQPQSPDILYSYPSTKSFKITKSKSPKDEPFLKSNFSDDNHRSSHSKNMNQRPPSSNSMKNTQEPATSSPQQQSPQQQSSNRDNFSENEESYYSDSFISESPEITKMKKRPALKNQTSILNYGMLEQEAIWMHVEKRHQTDLYGRNGKIPKLPSTQSWKNPKPWQSFSMSFTGVPKFGKKDTKKEVRRKDVGGHPGNLKDSETSRRLISAHRLKIKDLRNCIESLKSEMKDIVDENKILKHIQRKQEKALVEYNNQESELPVLMQRHNNEVASLREHLRKTRSKHSQAERTLRSLQLELHSCQQKLAKYKSLAEEQELPERDELYKKHLISESECQAKQRKIEELERYIENLTKNHKHQLNLEIMRNREVQNEMNILHANFSNLQLAHKEKEKELEIRNIYSNRIARPPHKLPTSYSSSPILNWSNTDDDQKQNPDVTPRLRAQEYANKLRNEEYRRRERMKRKPKGTADHKNEDIGLPPFAGVLKRDTTEERNLLNDMENERLERVTSKQREEEERRLELKREEDERLTELRKEEEEKRKMDELEEQRRQALEWENQMLEVKRKREERERLERETEQKERKWRDEEVKRFEEERKRMEEMQMEQKRLEQEQLAAEREYQEEQRRINNDIHMREARKQKDLLLAKMKAIDRNQVEEMLSSDEANLSASPSSKKSYRFTSVTENLHHGRPSHDYVTIPYIEKRKGSNGFYDDGNGKNSENTYVFDSFTRSKNRSDSKGKNERKTKLMAELFGDGSLTSEQNGYVPSMGTKKEHLNKSQFQWGDDLDFSEKSVKNNTLGSRETSSILAGGNMVLDATEDILLQRRQKQKGKTFQSTPVITAVDHYDEDIEEVIL